MKELIEQYNNAEKQLKQAKKNITDKLVFKNDFEWIEHGDGIKDYGKFGKYKYEVLESKTIDGVTYSIINRDDIDHEYHYALLIQEG